MGECSKCGFVSSSLRRIGEYSFCSVCYHFVPSLEFLDDFVVDKVDWRILDPFRRFTPRSGRSVGMRRVASSGSLVSRAPLGYRNLHGVLMADEDAVLVRNLFSSFLSGSSLNQLSKRFGLSVNGVKKVLSNRVYLGEVKFGGELFKGKHKPLIDAESFYAVQRRLKSISRKKK